MHTVTGVVQVGGQFARTLGYPTVNIPLQDTVLSGIYAGVAEHKGKKYNAALYADVERKVLEAHLFGFTEDIYGDTVTVTLLKKIRDTKKFDSLEELKKTITEDIEEIEKFFVSFDKAEKL